MKDCPKIKRIQKKKKWENWHRTPQVGGVFHEFMEPKGDSMKSRLASLLGIVKNAYENERKVRAFGSRWSLNNIAFDNDILVYTGGLREVRFPFFNGEVINNSDNGGINYERHLDRLFFVESGVMVKDLNKILADHGKALPTSGASDGQRLIGAVSTGTHGSANAVGAMQEYVKGISLVVPDPEKGAKSVFLQRETDKVLSKKFVELFLEKDTALIEDDELFNAAVVSFGCFGLIHGMLIEVEDMFELKLQGQEFNYEDIKSFMENPSSEELKRLGFDWLETSGKTLPFHFNVGINPYKKKDGTQQVCIQVMQKQNQNGITHIDGKDHLNHDLHGHVADQSEKFKRHGKEYGLHEGLRLAIEALLKNANHIPVRKKKGEAFISHPLNVFTSKWSADCSLPIRKLHTTSLEIGVPISEIHKAVELLQEIFDKHRLLAPIALRYVPATKATLGFTKFEKLTVTIELPGPTGTNAGSWFPHAAPIHQKIFDAFKKSSIPHSYHWGQQFPKNSEWVEATYGKATVANWKAQRAKLLQDQVSRNMFSNELTRKIGLT